MVVAVAAEAAGVVVVVVVKRHERLEPVECLKDPSDPLVCAHIKAAALDIFLDNHLLRPEDSATAHYTASLLTSYWSGATLAEVVQDVQEIFPLVSAELFRAFCTRSYPETSRLFA